MTTTITALEAAAILNIKTTDAHVAFARIVKRGAALGLVSDCRSCKGTGSYGMASGCGATHCYKCVGTGKSAPITAELVATIKARTEAGDLDAYFAQLAAAKQHKADVANTVKGGHRLAEVIVNLFKSIAAFVAETAAREPSCVAIESSHATACVKMNEIRATGRAAEIRRFGTARRSYEVWAL